MSLRIKKGDLVRVSASHAYSADGDSIVVKNQVGRVLSVQPKKGMAIVEGCHVFKKHQRARSQEQPGGIIEREMPLPLSKLMLVAPGEEGRAARFGVKIDEQGNKVRVLKIKGDKEITV